MSKNDVIDNVKYLLSHWCKWNKKSFLYVAIRIPALIVVPILIAYVPKLILECIDQKVAIGQFIIYLGCLSILIVLGSWIAPYMQQKLDGVGQIFRMRYAVKLFNKTMSLDYVDIESMHGREKLERSKVFTDAFYSGAQSFCDILCQFGQSIVGVISSMLLLYKLPFLMIINIIVACLTEFLLYRIDYKSDIKTRDGMSSMDLKFNYFDRMSHDFKSGKDIRLYSAGEWLLHVLAGLLKKYTKIINEYLKVSFSVNSGRAFVIAIRDMISYAFLIYSVLQDTISISDFIFYFAIIAGFSGYVSLLNEQYNQLLRCSLECSKYREYIDIPEKGTEGVLCPINERYKIQFKQVSFRYEDAEKDTLQNINFTIEPGENIAIVGENGAGKSTVIKLLCGLYQVTGGQILLNGENIQQYTLDSYHSCFSVAFQDYYFLPVSIAQNIALCPSEDEIDKNRLYQALEFAGIRELIEALPNKEQTKMNKTLFKDAVDFSGGELQKLLLARALYKNAPILILDEPTAALDPIAENELYLKYNSFSKDKTTVFISHRLSSTRFCDRIFFMSDGCIIEMGTHEELMQKKGKYYQMYQMQSYYYKEDNI